MHRRAFLQGTGAAVAGAGLGVSVTPVIAQDGTAGIVTATRFSVGSATVTAISDGFLPIDVGALSGISPEDFASLLKAARIAGTAHPTGVNAYVVDHGRRTLIDCGTGTAFGPSLGHMIAGMEALGMGPETVDAVVATHLHPDHVGGALVTSFPNAALHVSSADIDFWTSPDVKAQAPADFHPFFDMAVAAVQSFGDRVAPISAADDLGMGMTAMPLPGHTPGHTGVMLDSDGAQILFWGDIVHVGAVQFARPEVTIQFDADQDTARATRLKTFDMAATDGLMIAGAHIGFPGVGYLEKSGEGYAFQAAPWPYG